MNIQSRVLSISALVTLLTGPAFADCTALPSFSLLRSALVGAITPSAGANGGLGFNMWGTLVDNEGTVCAVAFSGSQFDSQWLGSRVISAQKANTANDFSLGHNATPGGVHFRPALHCRPPICLPQCNPAAVSTACSTAIPWIRPLPMATNPVSATRVSARLVSIQTQPAAFRSAPPQIPWSASASEA
jgi:hypothetical protein